MDEMNVLALIKGREQYIYLYLNHQRPQMMNVIAGHADDPDLSLTFRDAGVMVEESKRLSRLGLR